MISTNAVFNNLNNVAKPQLFAPTLRDCAALLLFGLIRIGNKDAEVGQEIKQLRVSPRPQGKPFTHDVEFAKGLLDKTRSARIPMQMLYYGLAEMWSDNDLEALNDFQKDSNERLSWVAVYKLLKESTDLSEDVKKRGFEKENLRTKIENKIQELRERCDQPCAMEGMPPTYLLEQIYWIDSDWRQWLGAKP